MASIAAASAALADEAGSGGGEEVRNEFYTVRGGTEVDAKTMDGFRTWRALACDRCHGPNQEGMVGPSLIEALKRMSKDDVKKTIFEGRLDKGMPSFGSTERMQKNFDGLYGYLKGRSDGAITKTHVTEMK